MKTLIAVLLLLCAVSVSADTLIVADQDGTTLIDSYMAGFAFDKGTNFGTSTTLNVTYSATAWYRTIVKVTNLRHILGPGVTITSGVFRAKCRTNSTNGYVSLATCHKPWTENRVTWNEFDKTKAWGIVGADSSASTCPDNSTSGTGCDYDSDIVDSVNVTATGWYEWTLDTAYLNAQYQLDSVWNYMLLSLAAGNNQFHSSEGALGETPRFEIGYIVDADTTNGVDTLFSHRREIMDVQHLDSDTIMDDLGEGNWDTIVDARRMNWGGRTFTRVGQQAINGLVHPWSGWIKVQNIPDTTLDSAFFFVSQASEQTADDGNLKFYRVLTGPAHEGNHVVLEYPGFDTGMTWEHAWAIGDITLDDSLVWDIPNHYTTTDSFLLSMTGNTLAGYANHHKSDDFKNLVQFWSDNPDSNFGMYVVFDDFGVDSSKRIWSSERSTETQQPFAILYWSAPAAATGQVIIIGEAVTEQRNKFTRRKCLPFGSL